MSDKNEMQVVVEKQPMNLIQSAIEQGMDMSQMEKLFDLQERWEIKEAAKSFKRSMCEFMLEKPKLIKTKLVSIPLKDNKGTMKYSFNPLPKIQKEIDPVLSKFGFTYRWEVTQKDGNVTVICIISHLDGHEERTEMTGPNDDSGRKSKIQQIGSSTSYLKRYTLESALGLSSDEDDDGVGAKKKQTVSPDSDIYDKMVDRIVEGKTTIEGIEKNYILTSTAKEGLINSINPDNLKLLFDLVEDKIQASEFENIKRIIENEEKLNYPKVLFTLTKLKNDKQ